MASIPMAGMPAAKFFGPPTKQTHGPDGKFLTTGTLIKWQGLEDLAGALDTFAKNASVPMKQAALTEIGLFGEAETKIRTPVKYGTLRSSIGHFTSGDLHGGDATEAQAGGIFDVDVTAKGGKVTWGTNIHYAPWIEDGFTMATRRAVWFDDVQGFRMVNPFSYRGAHMFAAAAEVTANAAPKILGYWIDQAKEASGL